MSTTRALEPALCSYLGTTQSFYTFNTIWRRWWKFHDVAVWRSNFRHFATFQSTVLSRLGNYLYRIVYWVSTVTYIIFCTRPFLSEKFHVAYFLLAAKFFFLDALQNANRFILAADDTFPLYPQPQLRKKMLMHSKRKFSSNISWSLKEKHSVKTVLIINC